MVSHDCLAPGPEVISVVGEQDPAQTQIILLPSTSETRPQGPLHTSPTTLTLLNQALDRIQMIAIREDPPSVCVQQPLEACLGEFYVPPTTHLVATVEDLTDMLDYNSENAYSMDENNGATANANSTTLITC